MNSTSPKSSLAKLGLHSKHKTFKVMILGQSGVGKTGKFTLFSLANFQFQCSIFDNEITGMVTVDGKVKAKDARLFIPTVLKNKSFFPLIFFSFRFQVHMLPLKVLREFRFLGFAYNFLLH